MARTNKTSSVHDKLLDALSQVDRPGEVCTWGDRPLTMPGLDVQGLGQIALDFVGFGTAFLDYDLDGREDLFVVDPSPAPLLEKLAAYTFPGNIERWLER